MPRRDTLQRQRHPGGRKPGLTPRVSDTIITAIRTGNHINTACHLAGVSTAAFYRWIARADALEHAIDTGAPHNPADQMYREFRDAVLHARAEAAEMMIDVVQRAAIGGQLIAEEPALDGTGNPIRDEDGRVVMKRTWTQPDGRLALAYLKVAQPSEWAGAPSRLELTGPGGAMLEGSGEVDRDTVGRLADRLAVAVQARQAEAIEASRHGVVEVFDAEVVDE